MSATPRASAVMTRGRFGGRRALKRRRKRETSDSEFVVSELTGVRREASSRSFVNVRIPERFRAFRCRIPGEMALDRGGEGVETVCGRLTSSLHDSWFHAVQVFLCLPHEVVETRYFRGKSSFTRCCQPVDALVIVRRRAQVADPAMFQEAFEVVV